MSPPEDVPLAHVPVKLLFKSQPNTIPNSLIPPIFILDNPEELRLVVVGPETIELTFIEAKDVDPKLL